MGLVLAIDYGRSRVGLAISDETNTIAQAIEMLPYSKSIFEEIKVIAENKNVELFLVGVPLGYQEKPTQMSIEVIKFADKLKEVTGIPYVTWNETLTSMIAKNHVKKSKIDSESARLILQEYLDYKKFKL